MDDRTLIERAAKAAGYVLRWNADWMGGRGCYQRQVLNKPDPIISDWLPWSPLTDDADIARLEADCEIDVGWTAIGVCSLNRQAGDAFFERYADHNGDKQKARRYASTRAAASLAMGE